MADIIWVNSESTRSALTGMGIRPDAVKVISPGFERVPVDVSQGSTDAGPLRILSVGSLCPRKDQKTLIRACTLLEDLDFHLDLVGSTDACPDYAAAVSELLYEFGLNEKVSVVGNLDRSGMDEIYSRSHILVHPALWEAFGMSVLEGMWHGLPVVAADTAAIPELVRDGENGILFQPGNEMDLAQALRRLMTDEKMRRTMGIRSHEIAEGMNDWKDTGNEFEELVGDLLCGSGS
jgi:glycosyltransferase involved in cell wall biosynthesis